VMDDRIAAAQLASLLLIVVGVLLVLEQRAQSRLRFASTRAGVPGGLTAQPTPLSLMGKLMAWAVCGLPVLLGFVAPVLWLLRLLWLEAQASETPVFVPDYLARFGEWAWASFRLAGGAAVLAVVFALALAFTLRRHAATRGAPLLRGAARLVSLGYAIPGAVVAVGILMITGVIQQWAPQWGVPVLVTGTVFGLMYAYLVRFSAVALQSVQAGYAKLPPSMDESALLLGADAQRTFMEIHLPLLARSGLAAALLVFVDAMKELPATLVLRPFGSDTLAVVAYQFARDERLAEAALPSLAIVAVGLIPVLMLSRALRKA
jgi:iron(III) transport system permease protein